MQRQVQRSDTGEVTERIPYSVPKLTQLGRVDELTGSGGSNNDDGYGYSPMP